jgi:sphinganine C4-monooxygenase
MPHHIAVCPTPFYYTSGPSAIPGISDHILSVATPTVAYWLLSGLFHILDTAEWKWLEKYRIHESQEVTKRNKVTRTEVVQMVVFQQVIQTMLAYWWTDGRPPLSLEAQCIEADRWRPTLLTTLAPLFGEKAAQTWARPGAYWMYWWAVPILQFALAM